MKTLDAPPRHPERFPYVRIDHDLCDWIRVPTPGELQDALARAEERTGARKAEAISGEIVALCWRDHRRALESDTGAGAFVELYEAGHSMAEIVDLASAMQAAFMSEHGLTEKAVKDAQDFTDATQPSESQT